jgi:hypothetical protein
MEALSFEEQLRSQTEPVVAEKPSSPWLLRTIAILGLLALFAVIFVFSRDFFSGLVADSPTGTAAAQAFRTLEPTWTPGGLSAGATLEPDIPGSDIPTEPLDQAALNRLALIGQQVDLVRDLPSPGSVPPLLVKTEQLASLLNELYGQQVLGQRESDEAVLRALGFLDTSQTLTDYGLSSFADPYGAVYAGGPARVYLIGDDFSDLLGYAYARQYAKAAVHNQFAADALAVETCSIISDACRARRAFANGDWQFAGEQWLSAYASASTFEQVEAFAASALVVQTEPPSDFALADLEFISQSGLDFVQAVFNDGGWEAVNALYSSPPTTSEQILHPEKFLANESAETISDPDLATGLGEGWAPMGQGTLGEWLTYLMLTQGANPAARIEAAVAQEAAEGWGGDHFQAYVREGDAQTAAAMHWAMESDAHAIDLQDTLQQLMTLRFTAAPLARGTGACWQNEAQRVCLFRVGDEVLLVQVPDDAALLDAVLAQYPDFR